MSSLSYPPAKRGRIIVWSSLATFPFGGMTWHRLHYLVGLRRLGFDVWYVEDSDRFVYSPKTYCRTSEYHDNVAYLAQQMEHIGLGDRWIFRPPAVSDFCLGARDLAGLKALYGEADVVLNLTGAQELRPDHEAIRCLVYIETDPVANQIAVAAGNPDKLAELSAYQYLFTYGENLGAEDCPVPVQRFTWHTTRPPVVLDWWRTCGQAPGNPALTTVANWKHGGNDIVWQGKTWRWSKHEQFERFLDLPDRSALPLEMAVGAIDDNDLARLKAHGWRLVDSASLADPRDYRNYLRSSLGEFTVAKGQYVEPRSGWFSDRSACYLAAGRPVVTQDTAFGKFIPTGEGLFAFSATAEALAAIDTLSQDYDRHSKAAAEIAKEYFDAERVLARMLDVVCAST